MTSQVVFGRSTKSISKGVRACFSHASSGIQSLPHLGYSIRATFSKRSWSAHERNSAIESCIAELREQVGLHRWEGEDVEKPLHIDTWRATSIFLRNLSNQLARHRITLTAPVAVVEDSGGIGLFWSKPVRLYVRIGRNPSQSAFSASSQDGKPYFSGLDPYAENTHISEWLRHYFEA